jgi:nicotinamidase-related amidase
LFKPKAGISIDDHYEEACIQSQVIQEDCHNETPESRMTFSALPLRLNAPSTTKMAAQQRFAPPAAVFDKLMYSAFSAPELRPWLLSRHINTLVITGSETDVCVLSSVLSAVDLGYRVIIAEDAICSSSDEAHDAAKKLYGSRYDIQIELTSVDDIIGAWRLC